MTCYYYYSFELVQLLRFSYNFEHGIARSQGKSFVSSNQPLPPCVNLARSLSPQLAALSLAGISGSYWIAQQQTALAEESSPAPTPASRRNVSLLHLPPFAPSGPAGHLANRASPRHQLPIYDSPAPPATLVPAPSPLQDQVGEARRFLQSNYEALHLHARAGAQQWIGWENSAEGDLPPAAFPPAPLANLNVPFPSSAHVKAMLPEDEDLNPGAL